MLPGTGWTRYLDETGDRHHVGSGAVNDYPRDVAGAEFMAKDFRTWAGTLLACRALLDCEPPSTTTEAERLIVGAVDEVAAHLGNTPAVCRRCYIHPAVIDAFLADRLVAAFASNEDESDGNGPELSERKRELLSFLEKAVKASH